MKYFSKKIWLLLVFQFFLLLYVVFTFQVQDVTLSKGETYEFNTGWRLKREKGEERILEKLPYLGKSKAEEILIMDNYLPERYKGKTMAFLSADKIVKIYIGQELIYEFGTKDIRSFGKTPGSNYHFVDIPEETKTDQIRIEMSSPYKDMAAKIGTITVGDRDILILQLLKDNILHIIFNILILLCGFIFFLLFLIRTFSKQSAGGMQYLAGYCVVAALYYFVETKVLHIFYGNQTFYSILVFLCLMMMPLFIALYYSGGELGEFEKRWKVMFGLNIGNIILQLFLQLTNLVDFMKMSFLSHGLIAATVMICVWSYVQLWRRKREHQVLVGMAGMLFMGMGGTIDIIRMYTIGFGDMGKFSRLGTLCFSIIMLVNNFGQLIKGYAGNIEENARLLQREMELIEKKNEQLKKANEQAEEARKEALAANAAKGKFLAQMSHEIRTPINAVLGMDTMILRETKEEKIKEYALDIQNAGQNLLALINDILDFSKIESGKLEILPIEYDFSSLIHDISNMLKPKAKAKNLKLEFFVDPKIPSKLLGDDVRIRQVLVNLLNNAVKYTTEGSIRLRVEGNKEEGKVLLNFSVEDTGIGIKEEDISKLFQEFQRIEEKRNRNIEGTGLGLNITARFLQLMGSSLKVESIYGKGSRFYFTLEQQVVDSTPIGNLEERIREQATEYHYAAVFTAPKAKLLVVDDNHMNLKVFTGLLKDLKVKIDTIDSGKGCLELLEKNTYDLIFLDHMMPEMDGIETLHRIKEMKDNPCVYTPVVALTANAITGAKEMYLEEGFDAFLPKPIHPERLEKLILKLLPRELLCFDKEEEKKISGDENREKGSLVIDAHEDSFVSQKEENRKEAMEEEGKGEASEKEKKEDRKLPEIEGIDWEYAGKHLPTKELLFSTLKDFYKTMNQEERCLEEFFEEINREAEPDFSPYRIKVHSMKSSANLIGATKLGDWAKALEEGARNQKKSVLDELHPVFMKEWRCCHERLGLLFAEERQEQEVDKDLLLENLKALELALEEFDMDAMDQCMEKIDKLPVSEEIRGLIEQLGAYVINMDTQKAIPLVEELRKKV
ncbi:MAG: response regulator [Lachnospiraceae bacterium]|nr:response regulator [Lachnospiraceae bacterium]